MINNIVINKFFCFDSINEIIVIPSRIIYFKDVSRGTWKNIN